MIYKNISIDEIQVEFIIQDKGHSHKNGMVSFETMNNFHYCCVIALQSIV